MTLLPVTNQLVAILCEKEMVSTDDFPTIKVEPKLADRRDDLIRAALSNLSDMGMIRAAGEGLWILCAPLNAQGQEVHLSMPLCNEIASVINTDLEAKDVDERVDALNIHEGHIIGLLHIIDEILNTDSEAAK